MTESNPLVRELEAAKTIAREAWRRIEKYYEGGYNITHKPDGPATDADREASAFILNELAIRFPEDGLLSEEAADNTRRLACERLWIVDPIDGTNDFIDKSGNFAIQIGLATRKGDGYAPRLGVVFHPTVEHLFFAMEGSGAWLESSDGETVRLRVSDVNRPEEMTAVVTRSHRTERFLTLMKYLGPRRIVTMGSMGLKILWVASGRADFYLNNARGMCKEWDVCAPHAILTEAGGTLSDLAGKPLRYNREDVRIAGGVLATNGQGHEPMRLRILDMERRVRSEALHAD